ncbi:protein FAR1-RELATED SEQUENCE 5-like isoform X1 [Hibiscus syriacus]|uniref:Protein FAR1-RELATED SEQUENCE 5-like isoform X1 n=2 Tax=Hibiscus syriacus TaxID=106335 RepID=A0A6A3CQ70_HIBSY|nr:protein FAR1-RELATED SEQUENCE 5-like isoform X1 [Hibiscus syriacus]
MGEEVDYALLYFMFTGPMTGTAGPHDFPDTDRSSEDETAVNIAICEGIRQELLEEHNIMDGEIISLEQAGEGLDSGNLEPYTGMTFQSLDDARDFYFVYAKRTGEGFRAAKHTHRKDKVLPPRPVTREGCKAMIRLAARDGGKWVVTKFVCEHSHKLMSHCKFPGELPTVNMLTEEEKDKKIQDLYKELQHEKERSAAFQQLQMIFKDLEEHAEFMSVRVEDIVDSLKRVELDDCSSSSREHL